MKILKLVVVSLALTVCTAAEVSSGVEEGEDSNSTGPVDQEVSETGHRKARFWRKMFKSLYSNGHKLAYPAAYLLGNYAKHLGGHGHHGLHNHHNKGHFDHGYGGYGGYGGYDGLGHQINHVNPGYWGHDLPLHSSYGTLLDSEHHLAGLQHHAGIEFDSVGLGLYPQGDWWGSAWNGYGWGDHGLFHEELWR